MIENILTFVENVILYPIIGRWWKTLWAKDFILSVGKIYLFLNGFIWVKLNNVISIQIDLGACSQATITLISSNNYH